ncbi:acyl-CoA thioester hydrolase YciA [Buchnera aphidicola]|uniref:Acyl-CoA thioester hydrolase YciA n=1 Tax=Buchnera aphidicola (Anoecia oenotherae) TaxID=1241833 RepID=A0A4D6XZA7_9GAMM|nr:acyl-CoA thioester hydrolase YciA [Buchnera aphidicola]QCI19340.1 acyl-CoA thioester hydrolase YciA [Buchnera aphidicola (Anoecia oenotherae)]
MKEKIYKIFNTTLVLKTLSMPYHTNANGKIFGGWIVSKIDIGGAILAKEITGGNVVTVKISKVIFLKPIEVGDLIHCYAQPVKIGNSSITIKVKVWIKKICNPPIGKYYLSTKATIVYVAINNQGKPRTIPLLSIL